MIKISFWDGCWTEGKRKNNSAQEQRCGHTAWRQSLVKSESSVPVVAVRQLQWHPEVVLGFYTLWCYWRPQRENINAERDMDKKDKPRIYKTDTFHDVFFMPCITLNCQSSLIVEKHILWLWWPALTLWWWWTVKSEPWPCAMTNCRAALCFVFLFSEYNNTGHTDEPDEPWLSLNSSLRQQGFPVTMLCYVEVTICDPNFYKRVVPVSKNHNGTHLSVVLLHRCYFDFITNIGQRKNATHQCFLSPV